MLGWVNVPSPFTDRPFHGRGPHAGDFSSIFRFQIPILWLIAEIMSSRITVPSGYAARVPFRHCGSIFFPINAKLGCVKSSIFQAGQTRSRSFSNNTRNSRLFA
ncbi:hypothetical protein SUGI_1165600 [Cryptomeria japonica]|nr:hypothetical protein SUGI_1165600 [Cryptomeria japonica]